jgi:hypothetical protein
VVTLANWRLLGSVMFDLLDRLVKTQLDQAELPQSLVEQFPYSVWSIDELEVALQIMQLKRRFQIVGAYQWSAVAR